MSPLVTIILTSWNHQRFIGESIESVLNQTFSDFELIIVDDHSTDDSWEIISSYTDCRIKTYRNEKRLGPQSRVNHTIKELARGQYIAIHHSDDVWMPDKLSKQVEFLDGHPEIGAVFTWAQVIDETGSDIPNAWFLPMNKSREAWLRSLFRGENRFCHPSVLIRRCCYEKAGLYKYGLAQTTDAEMWSRLLLSYHVHILQERLTKHRFFSDLSNTSAERNDVKTRVENEWNVIRRNFINITNADQIIRIFPMLDKFCRNHACAPKFLMAMACLYANDMPSGWALGLEWLMEMLNDERERVILEEIYGFGPLDLIELSMNYDPYAKALRSYFHLERQRLVTAIADQGRALEWHSSQSAAWESETKRLVDENERLEGVIADQGRALEWHASQRDAWEHEANSCSQNVSALENKIQLYESTLEKIKANRIMHLVNLIGGQKTWMVER